MAKRKAKVDKPSENGCPRPRRSVRLAVTKDEESPQNSEYFESTSSSTTQKKTKKRPRKSAKQLINGSKPATSGNEVKSVELNDCNDILKIVTETESKYFKESDERNEYIASCSGMQPLRNDSDESDESDSECDDWEEVEDARVMHDMAEYEPRLPAEGVEITVNASEMMKKREKKKCTVDDILRQQINRFKKTQQENIHKTQLLCFIARGLYLNSIFNGEDLLKAQCLSLLTLEFCHIKEVNKLFIGDFLKWFKSVFKFVKNEESKNANQESLKEILRKCLQTFVVPSEVAFIVLFVVFLRLIESPESIDVRLCYAVDPLPLKAKDLILTDKQRERMRPVKSSEEEKKSRAKTSKQKRRKVLSSDEDDEIIVESKGCNDSPKSKKEIVNYWTEVYLASDKRWMSIYPINDISDEPSTIEQLTHNPLLYVFAFDNNNHVKDVTKKYSSKCTEPKFKSNRVSDDWLKETLKFFKSTETNREQEEDIEIVQMLSAKPFPSTLSAYKNHPLYALRQHLLKYEVIYPLETEPLGSFRGDPIYPRSSVQTVHSSIYWRRQGRVVAKDAVPYKIAKARPKWDRNSGKFIRDLPLELFGYWQTEAFVPPEAKDGKVPRNEFGNVELFQPGMLPKGTVHIQLPGLLRIANKLNIDCVPAVVGFDCHSGGGGTHPVYDGFVVCEEFKDLLIAAFDEEEENSRKRREERKKSRIYENWKKIVKSVIIRERLRNKYFDDV